MVIHMFEWIPPVHRIHREVKQMKAFRDWTPSLGVVGEMVEWSKALNFQRSHRCCPRIESAKCLSIIKGHKVFWFIQMSQFPLYCFRIHHLYFDNIFLFSNFFSFFSLLTNSIFWHWHIIGRVTSICLSCPSVVGRSVIISLKNLKYHFDTPTGALVRCYFAPFFTSV